MLSISRPGPKAKRALFFMASDSVVLALKKKNLLQLNKCETDPYFLQNFQCTTMFISAFCKICDLNTDCVIVFVLISVDSQGDITGVISGSQMGSQLLQNTEIIKQIYVFLW